MAAFKKAVKAQTLLRGALFGPSGSGKTYTALAIATGLANGGRIGLIDSERKTASKYADLFDFDTVDLDKKNIDEYVEIMKMAATEGFRVLIIDSLSHAWQELLEEVDRIAKAKYKGNSWSAWSDGTPKQRKLINAILSYPGHVIATMRAKTEWTTSEDNGRSRPVRVGLAPEQGKGIEYEFDFLMEINTDHVGNVIKDRTGKFQDKLIDKPGIEFGNELLSWLNSGVVPPELPKTEQPAQPQQKTVINPALVDLGAEMVRLLTPNDGLLIFSHDEANEFRRHWKSLKGSPVERYQELVDEVKTLLSNRLNPPSEEPEPEEHFVAPNEVAPKQEPEDPLGELKVEAYREIIPMLPREIQGMWFTNVERAKTRRDLDQVIQTMRSLSVNYVNTRIGSEYLSPGLSVSRPSTRNITEPKTAEDPEEDEEENFKETVQKNLESKTARSKQDPEPFEEDLITSGGGELDLGIF